MRFSTTEALQALVTAAIPEAPSLEYKSELSVANRGDKVELLKDLTGMANGGGGTILFGVDEDRSGPVPVAASLPGLGDRTLRGKVEDIARDGVRPPLLVEYEEIDVEDGYVLAVDVQPSPLGPYMVHAHDQFRYFMRVGRSTAPMGEQQVRDAYALATRARERRAELWDRYRLPIVERTGLELDIALAAIPEEPLVELVDLDAIDPAMLRPPDPIIAYLRAVGLDDLLNHFERWADGIHASPAGGNRLRFHRDGAAGVTMQVPADPLDVVWLARVVNVEFLYLGWLWGHFQARRPLELRLELDRITTARLALSFVSSFVTSETAVVAPSGGPDIGAVLHDELLPWDVLRANVRHRLARRLVARVYNAFGRPSAAVLFETGQLYDRDGYVHHSVAGGGVWNNEGTQRAFVHADDTVRLANGDQVGWLDGGAIIDLTGDTVAVVEMAVSRACPDAFLPTTILTDPRARVPGGNAGGRTSSPAATPPRPTPTARWSPNNLATLLAGA